MKRRAALALLLTAGCSTAPVADLMDHFRPGSPGAEVAVAKVVVAPAPVHVETVLPRAPSGALPVASPGATAPAPTTSPKKETPPPQDDTPAPGTLVPAAFRPRGDSKDRLAKPAAPKQDVTPAVFRYQSEGPLPVSLPDSGVSLPR